MGFVAILLDFVASKLILSLSRIVCGMFLCLLEKSLYLMKPLALSS